MHKHSAMEPYHLTVRYISFFNNHVKIEFIYNKVVYKVLLVRKVLFKITVGCKLHPLMTEPSLQPFIPFKIKIYFY